MKKFLFFLILALSVNSKHVFADVCFYLNRNVAEKASQSLKKGSEIINYCELCSNAEANSETIREFSIKKVPDQNYYTLSINQNEKDIAYIYVKKSDNTYENLAYISRCNEASQNNISHFRSDFPIIKEKSQTQISDGIKAKVDDIIKNCHQENILDDCLYTAIKKQIIIGFDPNEQQIMLKTLDDTRKSVFRFYDTIYNQNKYCLGKCGTMAHYLAKDDEIELLKNMLSRLIYLNDVKNGY